MGKPCVTPAASDAKYAMRRRVVRIAFLAWLLLWFVREGFTSIGWPGSATACGYLLFFGAFLVPLLFVWQANCTYCGGGIKLDGRTCQRCGHVFVSGHRNV